jgi:hypothetical protein
MLARMTVRSCENVRAKQLGKAASYKKKAYLPPRCYAPPLQGRGILVAVITAALSVVKMCEQSNWAMLHYHKRKPQKKRCLNITLRHHLACYPNSFHL